MGKAGHLAGGVKLAIPYAALGGAGAVVVDDQLRKDYLYMIGVKTPPTPSGADIALGGVLSGASMAPGAAGTGLAAAGQIIADKIINRKTKKSQ